MSTSTSNKKVKALPNNDTDKMEAETKIGAMKENDSVESKNNTSNKVSVKIIEKKFESKLKELCKTMESIATKKPSNNSKDLDVDLYTLSTSVFQLMFQLGQYTEMGLLAADTTVSTSCSTTCLSEETRRSFQNLGKQMWMILRNYPNVFTDKMKKVETVVRNDDNDRIQERYHVQATGYIRAIAARLILMDHISTQESKEKVPDLIMSCRISNKEVEFGLKSFTRAGRAILSAPIVELTTTTQHTQFNSSSVYYTYSILYLATQFWNALSSSNNNNKEDSSPSHLMSKNMDEGFDSFVLLLDSASLLPFSHELGSPKHIIELLHNIKHFIDMFFTPSNNNQVSTTSSMTLLSTKRFKPCLARASYKHGNRLARHNHFSHAEKALHLSLEIIQDYYHSTAKTTCDESTLIQDQQQYELGIVLSKQIYYVLSYISQAKTPSFPNKAFEYLDQIEILIQEETKYQDSILEETKKQLNVNGGGGVIKGAGYNNSSSSLLFSSSSELGISCPKSQDKMDILARAQIVRVKARKKETQERASLAFSKILVSLIPQDNKSTGESSDLPDFTAPDPLVKSLQQDNIEKQFHILCDLSVKEREDLNDNINNNNNATSHSNNDITSNHIFQLAITAIRRTFIHQHLFNKKNINDDDDDDDDDDEKTSCCPYEYLFQRYPLSHHHSSSTSTSTTRSLQYYFLYIFLDKIGALLTCVQTCKEKNSTLHDDDVKLQIECLEQAREFCTCLTKVLSSSSSDTAYASGSNDKTLMRGTNDSSHHHHHFRHIQESIIQHFTRAISMYRTSQEFQHVNSWCDLLLDLLPKLLKSKPTSMNDENSSTTNNALIISETLLIKAHALTVMKHWLQGLECARKAWSQMILMSEQGEESSFSSASASGAIDALVTLFHCGVAYERNQNDKRRTPSTSATPPSVSHYDSLLELDNAITNLLNKNTITSSSMTTSTITEKLIMDAFPSFACSCMEFESSNSDDGGSTEQVGGRPHTILLGIQSRWITMLLRTDMLRKPLFDSKRGTDDVITTTVGESGAARLFCILRAYLSNFENLLLLAVDPHTRSHEKQAQVAVQMPDKMKKRSDQLDRILESVLFFLCEIRDFVYSEYYDENQKKNHGSKKRKLELNDHHQDKKKDGELIGDTNNDKSTPPCSSSSSLIWDNLKVKQFIGTKEDCVWIAEQIWNISIQMMKKQNQNHDDCLVASNLFAKAHDFILLSEEGEEKESMLSKGFLDCEQHQAQAQNSDTKLTTCDLSSEFSAQCLLLSVANAVDNLPCNNRNSNASSSKEKEEGSADEAVTTVSLMKKTYLRLLLAKKEFALYFDNQDHNDDDNSNSQSSHKKYIDTSLTWLFLRCLVEIGDDDLCMQFLSATNNTLANLELDQENNMDTHDDDGVISHLYLCSKRAELNKMTNSLRCLLLFCVDEMKKKKKKKHTTPGTTTQLQQLSLGDLQRKLIQIGSTVSDVVKIFHDVHSFSSEEKKDVYSQEEYDWFAVEAYNRGVNLSFLGDSQNSEKLITVALNLLPYCSHEIQSCHGTEMRLAFQSASLVEQNQQRRIISTSSTAMLPLYSSTAGVVNDTEAGTSASFLFS